MDSPMQSWYTHLSVETSRCPNPTMAIPATKILIRQPSPGLCSGPGACLRSDSKGYGLISYPYGFFKRCALPDRLTRYRLRFGIGIGGALI